MCSSSICRKNLINKGRTFMTMITKSAFMRMDIWICKNSMKWHHFHQLLVFFPSTIGDISTPNMKIYSNCVLLIEYCFPNVLATAPIRKKTHTMATMFFSLELRIEHRSREKNVLSKNKENGK